MIGTSAAASTATTLTLEEALAMARAQAPSVLAARARVEEARGRATGAAVLLQDGLVLEGAAGPRNGASGSTTDLDFGISQGFETGGRRRARIDAAEAAVERESADADAAIGRHLRDIAAAFMRGLHAAEQRRLADDEQMLADDLAAVAQRRLDEGEVAILDLHLALAAASSARAAGLSVRAEEALALGELRARLGVDPEAPLALEGTLAARDAPDLDRLLADAARTPRAAALAAELREAEAEVRVGEGLARPDLGATVRYERDDGDDVFLGGLAITLPVYGRGRELRAGGAARALRLRQELDALTRGTLAEVRALHAAAVLQGRAAEELERGAVASAAENVRLARRGYEEGEAGLAEVLLVQREALAARRTRLDHLLQAALLGLEAELAAGVLR